VKILQLVSCRGWSSDAYWAARISRELEQRGHTVTVGVRAGTEEKVVARAKEEGLERFATFAFTSGLSPGRDVTDVRHLARLLAEADVVHVHRGKEHWLAAIANRLTRARRPLVRTRHIVQAVRPHAANRWLYGRATDLVIAVSEAIRSQYVATGLVPDERVIVLHGAVDPGAFRPGIADPGVRARLGAHEGASLVGVVAGLRVMKGHPVVVEAAAALRRRGVILPIAFVGEGPWEQHVRQLVSDAGLAEQVTLTGFAADMPKIMAALDIALYAPLESEGMSRVVFEYLAAGRALIASRTGVVPEILHDGEDAILVPAGEVPALADAIARLAGDRDLRLRLGAAGRQLVARDYSGARVAERLERLYGALSAPAA
jgi:glycosyltransferase involved in cell wall biosynthesis